MSDLEEIKIKELELKANEIRQSIIEMLIEAKSGHTAGPLGMADIFTYLFFEGMVHDPQNPSWEGRDRVVLSNGHICPVLYATMAHAGYLPVDELKTLRKFGSRLQGHPHREYLPSLETSSGPLGSGLSQAVGMAIADIIDSGIDTRRTIYCLMSDGELDAGNSWEGAMLAGKLNLRNLIAIVDRNNIQIDGFTEDIMPLEPLADKWRAWNWHVIEIDGHSFEDIHSAVNQAKAVFESPTVIIAHTIPGKGVGYMERDFRWHGTPPGIQDIDGEPKKEEQSKIALDELRSLGRKISGYHND
ncbi:MAG: transketolase [Candidatus Zambryskibacteria bacterium CG_4_9_14_3_um_filter_40_16]|uniref:Transketolase n=2 Tax=Candidatus Zambryskiibacteriota TaxID=1817925 RepID=A0A2H0K9C9_9BACT|nr:MAG: transketolase [Candidatus Zambryskibacteria bacterium CG11_big_fil_rev_8_21_14_0_20_40_24]PJA33418.1 MAG: transketolase [Candidatus Zambryskibacteria bacterium CG_4_9_14_3_um_filter_40_16]